MPIKIKYALYFSTLMIKKKLSYLYKEEKMQFRNLIFFFVFSIAANAISFGDSEKPVLQAEIKESFANSLLAKQWTDKKTFAEYSMGAWVTGKAITTASESLHFIENKDFAHLQFDVLGKTNTDSIAT